MSLNRRIAILAALASLACVVAGHAQPAAHDAKPSVDTGYWKFSAFLQPATYRCITKPEDMTKFFDGPCKEKHTTCTYTGPGTVKEVGGGKLKFVGYWVDRHGKRIADVSAEGTYSARRYDLTVHSSATGPIAEKVTATWQSATCPPGAEH